MTWSREISTFLKCKTETRIGIRIKKKSRYLDDPFSASWEPCDSPSPLLKIKGELNIINEKFKNKEAVLLRLVLRELVPVETGRFADNEISCTSTLVVGVGGREPLVSTCVSTRSFLKMERKMKKIIIFF